MSLRRLLGHALLVVITTGPVAACSLALDTESLNEGCAPGSKACESSSGEALCVDATGPENGCTGTSCVPCFFPHADEVCNTEGACAIGTCDRGFQDCDLVTLNGCEVELDSAYEHCGRCNTSCETELRNMPRAVTARCSDGRCEVGECEAGHADCDGAATNGCETELSPEDCGRCGGCPGDTACDVVQQRCE